MLYIQTRETSSKKSKRKEKFLVHNSDQANSYNKEYFHKTELCVYFTIALVVRNALLCLPGKSLILRQNEFCVTLKTLVCVYQNETIAALQATANTTTPTSLPTCN